jgi:hypothetical protein
MPPIVFDDLSLRTEKVMLGGHEYELREATGEAATTYRNAMLKATQLGPNGKPKSLDGFANAEPLLVSLCLFKKDGVGWSSVDLDVIKSWPSRVQKELFNRAKEMSDLDENENADALYKQRERLDKLIADSETKEARLGKPANSTTTGSKSP